MKITFKNKDNFHDNDKSNLVNKHQKNDNKNKLINKDYDDNNLIINFYDIQHIINFMKKHDINKIILYLNENYYFQFKLHYLNIFSLRNKIENDNNIQLSKKLKSYLIKLLNNFDKNIYTYCNKNFYSDDICDLCSIKNVISNHLYNKLKYDDEFKDKLLNINNHFEDELDLIIDLIKIKSIHFLSGIIKYVDINKNNKIKIFGFNHHFFSEINKIITNIINEMEEFSYDKLPILELYIKNDNEIGIIPIHDLTIKRNVEKSIKNDIRYFKQTILKEYENKSLKDNFDIIKNIYHELLIYIKENLELIKN